VKDEIRQPRSAAETQSIKKRHGRVFGFLEPASILIVTSGQQASSYGGARHCQNMAYLSGLLEPGAAAVFVAHSSGNRSILFKRERDRSYELWNGPMLSIADSRHELGFDQVFDATEYESEMTKLLRECTVLYFESSSDVALTAALNRAIDASRARRNAMEIRETRRIMADLRLVKDDFEIACMERACEITAMGHTVGMQKVRPGMQEYELQAEIEYAFKSRGAESLGYTSIVAAGANGCCLHYTMNNCPISENDLVLVDAGAQFRGYTGDVTRTFPASGKFSREQAIVYDIVLDVQEQCVARVRPGESHWNLQNFAVKSMCERLHAAGILDRSPQECVESEDYKRFYGHSLGHWLGRDVHDLGPSTENGRPRLFQSGNIITIEPGLYFQRYDERIPAAFRGIAVRIEDDVLVTEVGQRTLTDCAKKRSDIETLMAGR
jgi:Xaa-Pro aminopeptidase